MNVINIMRKLLAERESAQPAINIIIYQGLENRPQSVSTNRYANRFEISCPARRAGAVQTDCYVARTDARQAAPFRRFGRHFYGPISVAPSPQRPPSHRSWPALPRFGHGMGMRLGSGQATAVWRSTGAIMGNVVNDFLLFSCLAAFVTGIVLAAASLLI